MKLERPQIYIGKPKATEHVLSLANALGIIAPKPRDFQKDTILKTDQKDFLVNFAREVEHTRAFGKAETLQFWYDSSDRFLQPGLEISMQVSGGLSVSISSSIGSHKATVTQDGITESPEIALANDICYYHKMTCDHYNAGDMRGFSRSFRAFLHSSVSIVDCFLYKYAFHIRDMIGDTSQYTNTLLLDSRAKILDRMEAWVQTFSAEDIVSFKNWGERSQFIELKNKRNEFTHPSVPTVGFEPIEVAKFLNIGSTGVGKLLGRMRRSSSASDRIGFISQISNLPKVLVRN